MPPTLLEIFITPLPVLLAAIVAVLVARGSTEEARD